MDVVETLKWLQKHQPVSHDDEKQKLAMDLQTRILSEEEMQQVMRHGIHLFIQNGVSYYELDKIKQFNEAICQQYRLRAIINNKENKL